MRKDARLALQLPSVPGSPQTRLCLVQRWQALVWGEEASVGIATPSASGIGTGEHFAPESPAFLHS